MFNKEDYSVEIKKILIDRSPNYVGEDILIQEIKNCDLELLKNTIKNMLDQKIIIVEEEQIKSTNQSIKYIKLDSYDNIPTKTHLSFGDSKIPRLLADTSMRYFPEQLNNRMELIAKQSQSLEKRFQDAVKEQQNKYWANVISILGFMVSVLALIIVGLPKITTDLS